MFTSSRKISSLFPFLVHPSQEDILRRNRQSFWRFQIGFHVVRHVEHQLLLSFDLRLEYSKTTDLLV